VAGSKRERELARAKYERQSARRADAAERRRRRLQVITSVVVGALVVVGVVALSRVGSGGSPSAAPSTTPQASASTTPSTPTNGAPASCEYRQQGTAARRVGVPPSSAPTTPATSTAVIVLNGKPVTVQLLDAKAPCTVNSFTHLAKAGYYNNTPCHRLTKGSLAVLQCGDPTGTGTGGPGYMFNDENLVAATYPAGTVAMANSGPNTNGSQFFIVYANSSLPPSYTPFGTVVHGLDVVQAIAAKGVKGGGTDGAPAQKVTIDRVVTG